MPTLTTTDTIVATATPAADGAIGIVRLSGPQALSLLRQVFRPPVGPSPPWRSHQLYHGWITDPATGHPLDEVLAVHMAAPHTYTREDMVEVQGHGGSATLRLIVALFTRLGARPAERGEFTLRAFLNGRIDLAQAEAVASLVTARTPAGVRQALGQLDGRLSDEIESVRALLFDPLARIEAVLDFAEEDVPLPPRATLRDALAAAAARLQTILSGAARGLLVHEGARAVLVGRPNAGKSSLLNALLEADRAIVTPIPGTTRDVLTESLNLDGVPVTLVDTAGIAAQTDDAVERLGVERSRAEIGRADVVLLVLDGAAAPSPEDAAIAAAIGERPGVVVLNKADLPPRYPRTAAQELLAAAPLCTVSALTGAGIAALRSTLTQLVVPTTTTGDDLLLGNVRHVAALRRAADHLAAAQETLDSAYPLDMVTIDLRGALDALGEVTGHTVTEDLLDKIFSTFCIGK